MATNFPTSIDSFTNPTSGDTLDSPSHAAQHANINDAMVAVQTKLGVGSGTIGTWTTYTPTLYGITLGNGTLTFEYTTLNEMVFVKGRLNFGSTTSVTGNVSIGLPVTAASSRYSTGASMYNDFGTRLHIGVGLMNSTDRVLLLHSGAGGLGIVNASNPFTWATNDDIYLSLFYEAA